MVGRPFGASIGSGLASAAGRVFGLELEGLSREDQEFETAKRFVRFASEAVKDAASASPAGDPQALARPRSRPQRGGTLPGCCTPRFNLPPAASPISNRNTDVSP